MMDNIIKLSSGERSDIRPDTAASATSFTKETKEEKVEVRNVFLIKHVKESSGELYIVGTFVQQLYGLHYDVEKSMTPDAIDKLSEKLFFDYRMNDLTADDGGGWVKTRRNELNEYKAKKTLQVNAPLEIDTLYDNFPFKTILASVMIELSSSATGDQRKRPTLLLHKDDRAQNVCLQRPPTPKPGRTMEEAIITKMDKSLNYDFITPYPDVSYLYDHEKEYCPKFKVSFYMVESGISKCIQIVFPMFLISFLNTLHVLAMVSDKDGNKANSTDYLSNSATLALTAVVIVPSIRSRHKTEKAFCANNVYIMIIFIGLSLSSIPEAMFGTLSPAKAGMAITWLSFVSPICASFGYYNHRRGIVNKTPKFDDRVPSKKSFSRGDLITVKDVAENNTFQNEVKYETELFNDKFTEVHV